MKNSVKVEDIQKEILKLLEEIPEDKRPIISIEDNQISLHSQKDNLIKQKIYH